MAQLNFAHRSLVLEIGLCGLELADLAARLGLRAQAAPLLAHAPPAWAAPELELIERAGQLCLNELRVQLALGAASACDGVLVAGGVSAGALAAEIEARGQDPRFLPLALVGSERAAAQLAGELAAELGRDLDAIPPAAPDLPSALRALIHRIAAKLSQEYCACALSRSGRLALDGPRPQVSARSAFLLTAARRGRGLPVYAGR